MNNIANACASYVCAPASAATTVSHVTSRTFKVHDPWEGWKEVWFTPSGYEGPWCKASKCKWASRPSRLPLTKEWWWQEVRCHPGEAPWVYHNTGKPPHGVR